MISEGNFISELLCVLNFYVWHYCVWMWLTPRICLSLHRPLSITQRLPLPLVFPWSSLPIIESSSLFFWILRFSIIHFSSSALHKTQLPDEVLCDVEVRRGISRCYLHAVHLCSNPHTPPGKPCALTSPWTAWGTEKINALCPPYADPTAT